ncbi:zinc transporter ZIP5 [Carettochelys insculpta]|uniref:zinc transporter ZIP5 n=1 Tax=Carettochelys insculpta TaxID=44489 RepID=UPI003EBFFE98
MAGLWLPLAVLWAAALLLPGLGLGQGHPSPQPSPAASGAAPLQDAEQEQGYYLRQLFGLYGANGTLSFAGLTRLLLSLGLGRVQVVELEHEGLGHGHVVHLDILEVQDHKHQHQHPALEQGRPQPPSLGPEGRRENATARLGSPPRTQPGTIRPPPTAPAPTRPAASWGPRPTCAPGLPASPAPAPAPSLLEKVLTLEHAVADHLHEDCLNVTQLLGNFGLTSVTAITPAQFTLLCPALLYQIDSRVCIRHYDQLAPEPPGGLWPGLGWGLLAVTLLSLAPALPILLLPVLGHHLRRLLLAFLGALAAGTLCGDALLHLWPHAQGSHHRLPGERRDAVLKGLSGLGAIYLLFLLERLLGTLRRSRSRSAGGRGKQGPGPAGAAAFPSWRGSFAGAGPEAQQLQVPEPGWPEVQELDHHEHSPGAAEAAWMVILGDGIHNLTDGLAIGAAFSEGVSSGLSTTVAVFCHELPHELGDVAVLLRAGLPLRRVLLCNLLSAGLAYLGAAGGALLSQAAGHLTPWVFSATAGIFLYVALVDMLPAMLRPSRSQEGPGATASFALQNLGFVLGAALMLCIALFEGQLSLRPAP